MCNVRRQKSEYMDKYLSAVGLCVHDGTFVQQGFVAAFDQFQLHFVCGGSDSVALLADRQEEPGAIVDQCRAGSD